jgi:two-component system, CAI-1 autoinducer sensor kinase/phosphatase CqsS
MRREFMVNISKYLKNAFAEGTKISRFNVIYASVIGASGHFALFFVYRYIFQIHWENLPLRILGVILCVGALLRLKIPDLFGRFFGIYWHFMLIYVLPFIITFFSLKNNFAEPWLYWEIFMVFVLICFVPNWVMFLLDLFIGLFVAVVCYMLTTPWTILFAAVTFNISQYLIVVVFSIIAGYVFNYSNLQGMRAEEQQKAEEKYLALEALAGSIAHEMRNPLSQIRHNIDEVLSELPHSSDNKVVAIPAPAVEVINKRLSQAQMAVNRGLHVITMTLGNFRNTEVSKEELMCLSAVAVTRKALEEYGYATEQEKHLIHLWPGEDFLFLGEENNYTLVLYNLLVNSIHALHAVPGGRIDISLQRGETVNRIIVRDNGPGISPKILSKIFDSFFTSGKKGGTGLGLAFCQRVMHSVNGEITCKSVEGSYTEFTLEFPLLDLAAINKFESELYEEYAPIFAGKKLLLAGIPSEYAPLLRRQLSPLKIGLDDADDSDKALAMIGANGYGIVLANATLPPSGAEKLAKCIKNKGLDIPVVVCSSATNTSIETVKGVDALISMPPALPELLCALKSSLEMVRNTLKESLSGKTVLVADDLDFNRRVIKLMLSKLEITILEATNGLEALNILNAHACDLLIIDLRMPVLDGFDTAKRIRSSPSSYREIPILGLSGNLDNATLRMAKESGINDSLIKPLKVKPFLQKVSSMLKISQPG